MCVLFYCLIGLAWCDVFKAMFKGLSHKLVKPSDHQETADFLKLTKLAKKISKKINKKILPKKKKKSVYKIRFTKKKNSKKKVQVLKKNVMLCYIICTSLNNIH